jgi:nitroreductase
VRSFLPDPLADGALETMAAAAQSASNSSNLNQWSVVAVSDPEARKQLAYLAREEHKAEPAKAGGATGISRWIAEAPTILLWVVDGSRNHDIARSPLRDHAPRHRPWKQVLSRDRSTILVQPRGGNDRNEMTRCRSQDDRCRFVASRISGCGSRRRRRVRCR